MKTTYHLAGNGMPLWTQPTPGTRAICLALTFKAGSRYESPAERGLAHLLEHMAFNGSERYADHLALERAAMRLGAEKNAYTGHQDIVFHITGRGEYLMQIADLLIEFVSTARLDAETLDTERMIVLQELDRRLDGAGNRANRTIKELVYGDHPLGQEIVGERGLLETYTIEDVRRYRAQALTAARGGLFIAGDLSHLDHAQVLDMMGRFPAGEPVAMPNRHPDWQSGIKVIKRTETKQSHLRLAWNLDFDATEIRNRAAWNVFSSILEDRLMEEIREQRGLCYNLSVWDMGQFDSPHLWVGAGVTPDRADEAQRVIREVVTDLCRNGPTEDEVICTKEIAATYNILGTETAALAKKASQHVLNNDIRHLDLWEMVEVLDHLTLDQVATAGSWVDLDDFAFACVGKQEAIDEFDLGDRAGASA